MRHKTILTIIILLWHVCVAQSTPADDGITSKIKTVENGLRYAINVKGKSVPIFTIHERIKHYHVPAVSIALINEGRIEWTKAYGYLDAEHMKRANTFTLFQAASISKPISAMVALKLVEQQRLDLDKNVNTYLRSWKVKNTSFTEKELVTLRRLLTHTAGLTVHGFLGYAANETLPTLIQILNGENPANSRPIISDHTPGSHWQYSGGGYVLLQQLLEDVTGWDFSSLMQRSVLSPINMKHSTFQQILPLSWQQRASIGHRLHGEKLPGNWHIYPESAAAGLWTTPSDLALYVIEVQKSLQNQSNHILSKQMTEKMLTKHLGDWGLGPTIYGENDSLAFGHGGSNEGFRSFLFGTAYSGKGAVIMTNSDDGSNLITEIVRSIAIAYDWDFHKPITKTIVILTPSKLATFAGTYLLAEENATILITAQNNHLLVKQLWNGQEFLVYPESDTDFFVIENGFLVNFESSTDGIITGLNFAGFKWPKMKEDENEKTFHALFSL
ncbi:unnamed protein product [Adineta steineri]|uniref:Beta-lactamase-related domain-containing protein n=2 Tax=Adineta steineri TaxID=433720 RepID=A0A813VQW2_9BILA|nr:unnamed protein product [Adineta steineri]CAF3953896.1 unnamed protein product [Adineta steineri]CAF4108718.1 unnamed protein product [Adineta steineri]